MCSYGAQLGVKNYILHCWVSNWKIKRINGWLMLNIDFWANVSWTFQREWVLRMGSPKWNVFRPSLPKHWWWAFLEVHNQSLIQCLFNWVNYTSRSLQTFTAFQLEFFTYSHKHLHQRDSKRLSRVIKLEQFIKFLPTMENQDHSTISNFTFIIMRKPSRELFSIRQFPSNDLWFVGFRYA